jgi:hypothetical protein
LAVQATADCAAQLSTHEHDDLQLPYVEFDQTEGHGFRQLADAKCFAEAGKLVEEYIERHQGGNDALWWHAAQMNASAGNYKTAAREARQSIRDGDRKGSKLMWVAYVSASVAFFERDKDGLRRYRDMIAENGQAVWGNRINLNFLDVMLENFDKDYTAIGELAMARWRERGDTDTEH